MKSAQDCFTLSNGVGIPCLGYGTFKTPDGAETVNAVKNALACGYRHIDTAQAYHNEASVGAAIKESGIARDEVFLCTKIWVTNTGYDKTLSSFETSLKDLQTDYVDLLLIHWPESKEYRDRYVEVNNDTWRAFERLYEEKSVRAIGVSNFLPHHLEPLLKSANVAPMVDQIERHPYLHQDETVEYCEKHGILVEAWSPLGQGNVLKDPVLQKIADKYHKSTAQVCIRWNLDRGILPLPKSLNPDRMKQNMDVFDFALDDEDRKAIAPMAENQRMGSHPDNTAF